MPDLEDLSRTVSAYRDHQISLDQFADWFRSVSRRKYAEPAEVQRAILEIDSLFSRLDYDGLAELEFREELANAVRPFASRPLEVRAEQSALTREVEVVRYEPTIPSFAAAAAVVAFAVIPLSSLNNYAVEPSSRIVCNAGDRRNSIEGYWFDCQPKTQRFVPRGPSGGF